MPCFSNLFLVLSLLGSYPPISPLISFADTYPLLPLPTARLFCIPFLSNSLFFVSCCRDLTIKLTWNCLYTEQQKAFPLLFCHNFETILCLCKLYYFTTVELIKSVERFLLISLSFWTVLLLYFSRCHTIYIFNCYFNPFYNPATKNKSCHTTICWSYFYSF